MTIENVILDGFSTIGALDDVIIVIVITITIMYAILGTANHDAACHRHHHHGLCVLRPPLGDDQTFSSNIDTARPYSTVQW